MTQIKKIEEMIENAEKKIHAGEWLRVDIVRRMMAEFAIWMNEEFKITLEDMQVELVEKLTPPFNKEEEE